MQKQIMAKMQQHGRHGNRRSGDKSGHQVSEWSAAGTVTSAAAAVNKAAEKSAIEQTKYRELIDLINIHYSK